MFSLPFEAILVIAAALLIISVVASKISDRFGIPSLLLFLILGMLAGSDGPGGIYFDNPSLAQSIGVVSLVMILFSGGLSTSFESIRTVFRESITLATLGVLLTALITGVFVRLILKISWIECFLIGAIVSSTDAAAVFSILRSKGLYLKGQLKPLLELESGSNDPMAVFLTIGLIQLAVQNDRSFASLFPLFIIQMAMGAAIGYLCGKFNLFLTNRIRLGYDGLYPVLTVGIILFAYGLTTLVNGSGFLAVYIIGLVMSKEEFVHKGSMIRFFDGLAWISQITMFLTLGLLVFPSHIIKIILPGFVISLVIIFISRPISVFLLTLFTQYSIREKAFIAWVGLRGAVPIILATYPKLAGVQQSDLIFNIVFFVVLSSVLLQGALISHAAKILGVLAPPPTRKRYPIEFVPDGEWTGSLKETPIPEGSWVDGKAIFEISLPPEYLVVLIARGNEFIMPKGSLILQTGDILLGLGEEEYHKKVEDSFAQRKKDRKTGTGFI